MKKYLVGIIAIVMATSFSAFTTIKAKPEKLPTDYYWFDVNSGQGNDPDLTNSQVSYISFGSSTPQGTCSGAATYNCKVGFNASQVELVEGSIYRLKTGEQTIANPLHKRSSL